MPQPGALDASSEALLDEAARRFHETGEQIAACRFRAALGEAMALAQGANRYLDQKAPWHALKDSPGDAATTLWVSLSVINCLKTALSPFLPFSSDRLHRMLGFSGSIQDEGWTWSRETLRPGQALRTPEPLFTKLDERIVERETQRVGQ